MASYASKVKKELTSLEVHPEHARAELSAFMRMNSVLTLERHHWTVDILTENPAIARRIYSLIKLVYGIEPELLVSQKMKLKKNNQYVVRLRQRAKQILRDLQIVDPNFIINTRVPRRIMKDDQLSMSYLRGAFLAGGSVNNPETSRYHLEIYSLYEDHNRDIVKIMNAFDLNAKSTSRRSGYITYLKGAEKIADFLRVIGAINAMLSFEDLRIMRDMRNSVNRLVNCDTANLKKTANAAAKQVEDIQLITQTVGLKSIPEKLQDIAQFRLDNQELSLKEVGEQVPGGPISKSGVNHRFKKISEIAAKIRQGSYVS